ncbi:MULTISPECIES: MFS transporter [Microbacterium]|uniref:MFS transporter n=1 Tax=Microbacterium TaxID=33882 RepID=UPI001F0E5FF5|nr:MULTISPECIES: MFS transporter [Microbacterium]
MSGFSGHLPGTREYRRLLAGLFFAGIATFAQLYSPQAVLPMIAADLGVAPATAALSVSACTLGLAAAVIPWSMVADRVGRVPAMALGILAATLLGVAAPFAGDIALFLVVRLLEGIALGAVPAVALAYLSEEVDAGHAAAAAGSYVAGTTVGGLAGRLVAGPVADLTEWRAGLWGVAGLCAASAVLFLWLVPRARGFVPHRHLAQRGPGIAARLAVNLRSRVQLVLYAQAFLLMGGFVAVYNYLGFHLTAPPFVLPAWVVTLLFLAYLAGTLVSPWAGTLVSRHGPLPVLLASVGCSVFGLILMFVPLVPALLVGLVVFTAGFFGAHTVASGWAPSAARPDTRAQASSLYYLAYYGGSSVFGWALGWLFADAGWAVFVAAVIAMCAVAGVLATLTLRRAPGPRPRA